uniref:T-complex 11 like 1 n=1 Tax=Petromyzon marinus TaxID=7757 RepID=S4RQG1_PETMA
QSLLLLLLPGHTRLRSVIEEALDLQLIAQEAQNGALDFPRLATFILDTMGSLCAPARDDDIARLRTVSGVVPLFREIFQVLELMKMDMANFTIQSLRPHLQEQAIEYERKKFQEFLNKQPNALEFTTRWLTEAAQELGGVGSEKTAAAATAAAATTGERGATSAIAVLNHAYATLLSWDHGSRSFPETVLMDQARLEDMQLRLWGLELLAAVLLVTVGAGGTAVSGLSAFAGRLKSTAVALLEGKHI